MRCFKYIVLLLAVACNDMPDSANKKETNSRGEASDSTAKSYVESILTQEYQGETSSSSQTGLGLNEFTPDQVNSLLNNLVNYIYSCSKDSCGTMYRVNMEQAQQMIKQLGEATKNPALKVQLAAMLAYLQTRLASIPGGYATLMELMKQSTATTSVLASGGAGGAGAGVGAGAGAGAGGAGAGAAGAGTAVVVASAVIVAEVVVVAAMVGYIAYQNSNISAAQKDYLISVGTTQLKLCNQGLIKNKGGQTIRPEDCKAHVERFLKAEEARYMKDLVTGNTCPWYAIWCRR